MKTLAPVTFRAITRAWIGEAALPILFFGLLAYTLVARFGFDPLLAWLGVAALSAILVNGVLLPFLRTIITFERSAVEGRLNGRSFRVYYGKILAAWRMERGRRHFLCLGTSEGTLFFPLSFLDDQAVWNEIRLRAPAAALEPEAIERLPDYQRWAREQKNQPGSENPGQTFVGFSDANLSVAADHWTLQIIGWVCFLSCLVAGISAWLDERTAALLIFALLGGVCLYGLTRWGVTLITPDTVRRHTFLESRSIEWDDVRWVETDPLGLALVLRGETSQLVISGPALWSAMGRRYARNMFYHQLRERGIPIRRTLLALLRFSRQRARRDNA